MSEQLTDIPQNSESHNCPIENNDSRVNKIYGQSYCCYLIDVQRVWHERKRRCWRAPAFSLSPPLSFKKVSTAIAFTRYLLIVTALLRRHKSAGYDHLSGHSAVRGNPPMDYYLRRDYTACIYLHMLARVPVFFIYLKTGGDKNFAEIDYR